LFKNNFWYDQYHLVKPSSTPKTETRGALIRHSVVVTIQHFSGGSLFEKTPQKPSGKRMKTEGSILSMSMEWSKALNACVANVSKGGPAGTPERY